MTISRLLAIFWPVFGRILRNSAHGQVQVEGGSVLNPRKSIGTFPDFLGFDPKSRFWVKNHDGRRFILVVQTAAAGKVQSPGAPKRHTQNPMSLWGFVVSFWRLVLFGAGHVVQVDL